LTEQLGAQGTVSLLNEYFTLMVECIQREEGMLDKFIGDAIMAAFGYPESHEDDADRAMRAAIAMIRTLTEWNRQRQAEGKRPVNIGIGMNTIMWFPAISVRRSAWISPSSAMASIWRRDWNLPANNTVRISW